MPDFDRDLALLRTDLHDTVHQPELDEVIARSRQRTTRRRTQIAAIAAVFVVAAAIPLLRGTLRPPNHAATPPTPIAPTGPFLTSVDFGDERHGYAIRATCKGEITDCTNELLVTSDGEHWEQRALPPALTYTRLVPATEALGPEAIVVGMSIPGSEPRFYSADGGRTWQELAPTVSEFATIPAGALLEGIICDHGNDCTINTVATDPASGRSGRLANPPPVRSPSPAAARPVAGGYWVWGYDEATGKRTLAVTRDAGHSWTRSVLPISDSVALTVTTDGNVLYATSYGGFPDLGPRRRGLAAIFRSTDGGVTWEQTWQAKEGVEPRAISSLVAAADGRLLLTPGFGGPMWASTDGGKTFQPAQDVPTSSYFARTGGGYLAGPDYPQSNVYKLSVDGVRWKEINVG